MDLTPNVIGSDINLVKKHTMPDGSIWYYVPNTWGEPNNNDGFQISLGDAQKFLDEKFDKLVDYPFNRAAQVSLSDYVGKKIDGFHSADVSWGGF